MPRERKNKMLSVGGKYEVGLVNAFGNLSRAKGVSMREALRRVMVAACQAGQIPGVQDMDIEERENEKFGTATPVYDGEADKRPTGVETGKKAPVNPAL